MKRILLFLLLPIIFVSFYLIKQQYISAQEKDPETTAEQGYGQVCLNAVFYDTDKSESGLCGLSENCPKDKHGEIDWKACEEAGIVFPCTYSHFPKDGANFELKGSGFTPGAKVYPYYCVIPTEKTPQCESYCTSGNPNNDQIIFGADMSGIKSCNLSLEYNGTTDNTFFSNVNGELTVNGKINKATPYVSYVFYGFYLIPPVGQLGQGGEGVDAENKSQQQGTIPFSTADFVSENTEKKCVDIFWDPYGRVFDSKSLEPVEGINVRLLSSVSPETMFSLTRGQNNPETTGVNGVFNFVVPEGIYYLRLANLPLTHKFISNPNLNPKYSDIYYKAKDNLNSIYRPDEEIKELIDTVAEKRAGIPDAEERDIPLDPGANSPYLSQIKFMQNTALHLGNVDASIYRGQSSHPYPIVSFVRADNKQLVFEKEMTDKNSRYGFWKVVIPNEIIPADTPLEVILKKNPKYFSVDNDLAVSKDGFSFEPILRYIKGYVADGSGREIGGAEVRVRLKMNNAIYSTVKAEDDGLIEIPSNKLPLFSYYLEIKAPNSSIRLTKNPSTFAKENEDYLVSEKINLMKDQNIIEKEKSVDENQNGEKIEEINKVKNLTNLNPVNKMIVIIVIIILLLVASAVLLLFYIKRQK